jgi:hypothetical protein
MKVKSLTTRAEADRQIFKRKKDCTVPSHWGSPRNADPGDCEEWKRRIYDPIHVCAMLQNKRS